MSGAKRAEDRGSSDLARYEAKITDWRWWDLPPKRFAAADAPTAEPAQRAGKRRAKRTRHKRGGRR